MIDVTTCDHYGHWDVEDIKRLCEYRDQLRGTLSLAEEGLANYAQENEQLCGDLSLAKRALEDLAQEVAQLKLALDAKLYSRRKLESDNRQLRAALQDLADCCGHDDDKALLLALTNAAKTLLECSSEP
jgi:chromosome segregation ATPase